jgi:nucleotide-binding universal stress UspA family protein
MNGQTGRIVVGFDGSTHAAQAVEWAAAEAARRGRPLTVFYVIDYGRFVTGGGNSGATGWGAFLADEPAKVLVDQGVELARKAAPDVQVTGETKVGRPIGALFEASRTADLMVVGTRGYTELANLAVGSVAASIAAHAHCPVVIVRGDGKVLPGPAHPVVVGVDGSTASQAALVYAAGTARDTSAPLVVVCAWNVLAEHGAWVGVDARVLIDRDDLLRAERTAAREILDAAVERVRTEYAEVALTASLVEAAPAAALITAGADAGLVVVGTRGHGAFTSLLLGSVSHAVVYASTRPVAVVRGEIAAPADEEKADITAATVE